METSSSLHPSRPTRRSRDRGASRPPPSSSRKKKTAKESEERGAEERGAEERGAEEKSSVVDVDRVREEENEEKLEAAEEEEEEDGVNRKNLDLLEYLLLIFILTLVLLFLPVSICFCVKVVREHERAVIFRLGHLLQGRPAGPGLIFCLPLVDVCHKVDVRLKMLKVPAHTVVTRDLLRPELSAVCFYKIQNLVLVWAALSSLDSLLQTLVQSTVRDLLAQQTLSQVLMDRNRIGQRVQKAVDAVVCRWGVRVERVDLAELMLPADLPQVLSAEAEAKRPEQVSAAGSGTAAWDGFRSSTRLLHPVLVLQVPPDLLHLNPEPPSLPPPPPPVVTDSPMM